MITNIATIVSLTAAGITLFMGVLVFSRAPKDRLNQLFLGLCLASSYLATTDALAVQSSSQEAANLWLELGFLYPFLIALLLHFVLVFTGYIKVVAGRLFYLGLYGAAALMALAELTTDAISGDPGRFYWGWSYQPAPGPWGALGSLTSLLPAAAALLCLRYYLRLPPGREKKAARLAVIGLGIPIAYGSVSEGLLPLLGMRLPLSATLFAQAIGFGVFIGYGMWKYGLFTLTPAAAAQDILDTMSDGLTLLSPRQRILEVNPAMSELLGYSREELLDLDFAALFADPDGAARLCRHAVSDAGEDLVNDMETAFLTKSGASLPVSLSGSTIRDQQGALQGCICIVRDIRQRKEEENRERQLRAQLLQSEKMAAVGQLVSGVAHELNNPLASIMGYAQYLLMKQGDGDQRLRDDLGIVYQEAERAAKIVSNLLAFARKHEAKKSCVDINQTIAGVLALRTYELKVANITVETDLEPELPWVMVDQHQIEQALLNLINNAEQAIGESGRGDGRIEVATELVDSSVKISVNDNGSGIPESDLGRIFDPFFTTKEVGKGTGLGLSICYGIAQEHDGDIQAQSRPGQGASFTITLPLVSCRLQTASDNDSRPPDACTYPDCRILVVDDELHIGNLLKESLADVFGGGVDVVTSGRAALEAIDSAVYDIIISDIKMPRMDGKELFRRIEERDRRLARRVIFITGDAINDDTREFLSRHDNPALLKPFDLEELKAAITARMAA